MKSILWQCIAILLCCHILIPAESQIQKIYLHPKAVVSGKQSQFVDSVQFIPLQLTRGVTVSNYNDIDISPKYFVIIDYPNKTILLYSKNGGFVKRINYKKIGEGFFPYYEDFTNQIVFFGNNKNYSLTPKDEIKIKIDRSNPRNKKYFKKYTIDLNDTLFAIKKDIPDESSIMHARRYYADFYSYGEINTSQLYKDSLDFEFKIYKDNELVKGFFLYNRLNEPRFLYTQENILLNRTNTPFIQFITRPFCDTIYKMVNDSMSPAYQIVLPLENSLPASFYTHPFKNKTERDNFNSNNGWMLHQVHSFYETSELILFSIGYLLNFESYIYNKQTRVTYKIKNIRPDISLYNLQILENFRNIRKGDKFYKILMAGDLIEFFEQNKDIPVPEGLKNYFQGKPHNDAPIIIEFKLKNSL